MKLDEEIEHLNQMIIRMSEQVMENLRLSIELYHEYDEEKANLINDDVVDLHERLIDEMCLNIMLKERPYASDLRRVTGILKLVTDLERLGDHAEDLATFAKRIAKVDHQDCETLNQMVEKTFVMVKNALTAYINQDTQLAESIIQEDDVIDNLYEIALEKIIKHLDNKEYANDFSIYTTLVVKYIERIADHAVNIAEWVIYIVSGYHKDKRIF